MINLTFGEQVKIVLSRKGMTIKELAEEIEAKTGKKMSRQNLTQRLGRDNFQEQDMRMIADILGCSFQLSILASLEAEKASVIEDVPPTGRELEKLLEKQEKKMAKAEARKEAERDLTVGEFVDMMGESVSVSEAGEETGEIMAVDIAEAEMPKETEEAPETGTEAAAEEIEAAAEPAENIAEEMAEVPEAVGAEEMSEQEAAVSEEMTEDAEEAVEEAAVENVPEEAPSPVNVQEEKKPSKLDKFTRFISTPKKNEEKEFQPIRHRNDIAEDRVNGDVNPYTGREYQTNSVRMHPKRIGYVQVYDRKEHKWTDMTEWAFLGFEERKKATLGKDYEPPIYLD